MMKFWAIYFLVGLAYFFYNDVEFRYYEVDFLSKEWPASKWYTQMLLFIVLTWPAWLYKDFTDADS